MRQFLYICVISLLALSCDDGDVFEVSLEFEDTFKTCGNVVFHKTKDSPPESISIQLAGRSIEDFLNVGEDNTYEEVFQFSSNSNSFNYRTYSSAPDDDEVFCNDVPSATIDILTDAEDSSGTATLMTVLVEDDDDGIPAELEDVNGNGDLEDDDTDGDGIPNYLDVDDDGDNVLTTAEGVNYTEEDGLVNAQDTDGNGTPDYLDNDDDGDNVATRDEENINVDNNPQNDVTDPNVGADYLNPAVATTVTATEYREHNIQLTYTISISIVNLSLPNLVQQNLDFGTLNDTSITNDSRVAEPIFN
nr:hypothetical protein [uncultured Psychroserpens sp.]